ncbi:nucleoside diphosphate kinase regulator [Aggregicoccus sp. 17bor-14]|uniref:nucleoside diphosphate kinase regulator n=1 Tax=Myxococcaceae TaxID=31 RepID=UPI00129CF34C|nr:MULTISPECIES: nucleoside diphosphate kinase regulator [Myxococcaceae]MBF5040762.1 nucleoside diphosphate kinase regulator [Simulacricoccus sp. 17bor-14]MRI86550.1 nucleoside diphosphate kinase regulator [Aggregicoccus sp. 17bor-14]
MSNHPRITVSRQDFDRLQRLIEQHAEGRDAVLVERLEQELLRADVVEQVPPDVVAMNSTVLFEEEETGARRQVRLCYPLEARGAPGALSVLAPVGSALLGLSVGQSIEWQVPSGRRRIRIVALPQALPEAAQPAA